MNHILKSQIVELKQFSGNGTTLISLYIPPNKQIHNIIGQLREERGQARNIKSKSTMNAVVSAIDSAIMMLKNHTTSGDYGLVVFCGEDSNQGIVGRIITPPKPLTVSMYRCESKFILDPLEALLRDNNTYVLVVLDRKEICVATLNSGHVEIIKTKDSQVPNKHGQGGQSALRFARLLEEAINDWFKDCAEIVNNVVLSNLSEIKAVFVGGPGFTKNRWINDKYLDYRVRSLIGDTFDVGYTDESGIKELIPLIVPYIENKETIESQQRISRFFTLLATDDKLACYGDVVNFINDGRVDEVFISDTKNAADVDNIIQSAERFGTRVTIVTQNHDEGKMLVKAFGGCVAILRY